MDRAVQQCAVVFLMTVGVAVVLRCAYQAAPGVLLGLFAPQNSSVWELSKIGLWPCLAAALLGCAPRWGRQSLCAYLMVAAALPVALLFVYWFFHLVCGICSGLLDAAVWVCLLAVGDMVALALRKTGRMDRCAVMAWALVGIWAFVYTVFSLYPAELPLFAQCAPRAAMAVIGW